MAEQWVQTASSDRHPPLRRSRRQQIESRSATTSPRRPSADLSRRKRYLKALSVVSIGYTARGARVWSDIKSPFVSKLSLLCWCWCWCWCWWWWRTLGVALPVGDRRLIASRSRKASNGGVAFVQRSVTRGGRECGGTLKASVCRLSAV